MLRSQHFRWSYLTDLSEPVGRNLGTVEEWKLEKIFLSTVFTVFTRKVKGKEVFGKRAIEIHTYIHLFMWRRTTAAVTALGSTPDNIRHVIYTYSQSYRYQSLACMLARMLSNGDQLRIQHSYCQSLAIFTLLPSLQVPINYKTKNETLILFGFPMSLNEENWIKQWNQS